MRSGNGTSRACATARRWKPTPSCAACSTRSTTSWPPHAAADGRPRRSSRRPASAPPATGRGSPAVTPTVPPTSPTPPRQHCWIESDAFDRSTFAALVAETPSLAALLERGAALVPHARELLEDLFCLLYKL